MNMNEEKKYYEIGFLLKSEDKKAEIKKILEKNKAEITEEGAISGIKLEYPIKKENFAYFGYIHFSAEPESAKEIDKEVKQNPAILRHLVVIYPVEKINKMKRERRMATREGFAKKEPSIQAGPAAPRRPKKIEALSNEDLEKKLEEILE